ncbi:MAG: hypothetical protein VX899_06010 [Myxococcota bacterium]|nr:hypothetical protein [Myxococcota bacterium]
MPPFALITGVLAGCTSFRDCSTEPTALVGELPSSLGQTALYSDIQGDVLNPDAIAFTPRFPLWTDGASKARWIVLPEGTQVDTSDPEQWRFPVGTQLFKEFTRDGVRVETRLNLKTADGWIGIAYLWSADQSDASPQHEPLADASGTQHDVPGQQECAACHGGRESFTLGFSQTQLELSLRQELYDRGLLSDPVEAEPTVSDAALAGLGVLHGNCSHCHNSSRHEQAQATDCFAPGDFEPLDLSLPGGLETLAQSPALQTARWQLGDPGDSEVLRRMSERNLSERTPSMPPLGTELVDQDGIAKVQALLAELEAQGL